MVKLIINSEIANMERAERRHMKKAKSVDEYISSAPKDIQPKLKTLRALIKKLAPKATEKISYSMPYYNFKGHLVFFGYATKHIGLYFPPPLIQDHKKDLKNYTVTKSAIHLPRDKELPIPLIKKLIKDRMKYNRLNS